MQVLSSQVEAYIERSSWIRRMFETGIELKKQYGADQVYDFSLGNPDLPPPPAVGSALAELAEQLDQPLVLGYMPNAGYPEVRSSMAACLSEEQGTELRAEHVVMTCGAAGAMNAVFRAILEPGDEVVCPAPFFVEYVFYVENFGGKLCPVPSAPLTFELDLPAIERALSSKTRAVIVNSPNNPTGQVYSREDLEKLVRIVAARSAENGRPIFLVSDEPYRFLAYDGVEVPPVLPLYPYTVVVGSFSKSLSLAGERLGYLAANPAMPDVETLLSGVVFTNRTLGFVNAPAIAQRVLASALGAHVDLGIYDARRRAMARVLSDAGIEFSMPQGAFYFFPRIPVGEDDSAFVRQLMEERVLAVPGSGFGYPGYFRLAFCVDCEVIERAAASFNRAVAKARSLA